MIMMWGSHRYVKLQFRLYPEWRDIAGCPTVHRSVPVVSKHESDIIEAMVVAAEGLEVAIPLCPHHTGWAHPHLTSPGALAGTVAHL